MDIARLGRWQNACTTGPGMPRLYLPLLLLAAQAWAACPGELSGGMVEDQREAGHEFWGLSPYLTFWQSEFVRLRGQYSYRDHNMHGTDQRFELQLTFAAGPHKHEHH